MADDKLRQELYYMVRLATKYDFTNMDVVEAILRLESERSILDSVFGQRFKKRIFDIASGVGTDGKCVICGKAADNQVICAHCIKSIDESSYAKSKDLPKGSSKLSLSHIKSKFKLSPKFDLKTSFKYFLIGTLIIVFAIQVGVLALWFSIPNYNSQVVPRVSNQKSVDIASKDEAYKQLLIDFPEKDGYKISFARMDKDFAGRFKIKKGECCQDVEEKLSDTERYDYFFDYNQVYVYYITKIDDVTGIVGMAEVNDKSQVLLCGSFNDGRKTDCWYRFR